MLASDAKEQQDALVLIARRESHATSMARRPATPRGGARVDKDEERDNTMRWTLWEMTGTRIAQTVVALALMLAASPAVEFVTFGLKWT